MTQDALIRSLQSDPLPVAALREAVAAAPALAPAVLDPLTAPAAAMPLLAAQRLAHRGLHVLAAARHQPAFRVLTDLIGRASWAETAFWLGPQWPSEMPSLLFATFDGEPAPLFALAGNADGVDGARWAALLVLARLVRDGAAPRLPLLALLDRIDADDPAPRDGLIWLALQDAVRLLGLTEWRERIAAGWDRGRLPGFDAADRAAWTRQLHEAAANPGDDAGFRAEGLDWIDDPVATLQRFSYPAPLPDAPPPGPGLPDDARRWLDTLLWYFPPAPGRSMSLEEADGFLTALAAGPAKLAIAQAMRRVFGATPAHKPHFPSPAHAALAETLLAAHAEAIAARLGAGEPPVPHGTILPLSDADLSAGLWAQGFARGAGNDPAAWQPVLAVPRARDAFALISSLIPPQGAPRPPASAMSMIAARRQTVIARVPAAVRAIADTVAGLAAAGVTPGGATAAGMGKTATGGGLSASLPTPVSATAAIGRNAPCPCGSGRKFKHCCGAHKPDGSAMIAASTR